MAVIMQRIFHGPGTLAALCAAVLLALGAHPGCAAEAKGKDTLHSLRHDGRARTYLVHLPPAYDGVRNLPAVLVFHGGGGHGEQMAKMTGFSRKADREGFIAVYPNGSGRWQNRFLTWNAGNCCAYAYENGIDDVGFVRSLIGRLRTDYAVDPRRIYVTGISNGGMMSYRLACELADLVAAAGPVAGTQNIECRPSRPVSLIALHGTADLHVRYTGGPPLRMADIRNPRVDRPVSEAVAFWVRHNGCPERPQTQRRGKVTIETYEGCTAGTAVRLVTLDGEGHTWPGGTKWAFWADEPSREISATDAIWAFFAAHPRRD